MAKYRVKADQDVTHNNLVYKQGATLELTEEQAAAMPWAVEPAEAPVAQDSAAKAKKG